MHRDIPRGASSTCPHGHMSRPARREHARRKPVTRSNAACERAAVSGRHHPDSKRDSPTWPVEPAPKLALPNPTSCQHGQPSKSRPPDRRCACYPGRENREEGFHLLVEVLPRPDQPRSVKLRARERPIPASVVRKRRKGVSYFAQTLSPIRRSLTSSRDAVSKRSVVNQLAEHPSSSVASLRNGRAKGNTMQVPSILEGESLKRLLQGAAGVRSQPCLLAFTGAAGRSAAPLTRSQKSGRTLQS